MHPGFAYWWHARRHAHGGCGEHAEHGPGAHFGGSGDHDHGHGHGPPWARHGGGGGGDDELGGGSFGVRRPLRFLAHKLDLNDDQVAELARILDDLKIERAQGAVDQRRTTSAFADAVATAAFDEAKVKEAAESRVKSAERLRDAVVRALGRIHALLDGEQRAKLAYLLRTGALSI